MWPEALVTDTERFLVARLVPKIGHRADGLPLHSADSGDFKQREGPEGSQRPAL